MYQEDSDREKDKVHLWLSILAERRGRNASKNWILNEPRAWPQLPDPLEGSPDSR